MITIKRCPSCGWFTRDIDNQYSKEEIICPICETKLEIYNQLGDN